MDPANWFDDFGILFRALHRTEKGKRFIPNDDLIQSAKESPLFCTTFEDIAFDASKHPEIFSEHNFPIGPFPIYRSQMEMESSTYKSLKGIVFENCDIPEFKGCWLAFYIARVRVKDTLPFHLAGVINCGKRDDGDHGYSTAISLPGGEFYQENGDSVSSFSCFTAKLCYDLLNPHLHLISVQPNKKSKPVEWLEQRTHYVLIHKNEVPRLQCKRGSEPDLNVNIKPKNLMAHSRRAHFRLLSSPRFKNKQGQRLLIRSMWVGPKEWKGASGQIYKFIERPNAIIPAHSTPESPVDKSATPRKA